MEGDPLRYFRIEARELHDGLTDGLLRLERGELDAEGLRRVLRQAHTLKGAARVVREAHIAEHAHGLEDVLGKVNVGAVPGPEVISDLLRHLDAIGERLQTLSPRPAARPPAPATPAAPGAVPSPTSAAPVPAPLEALEVVRLEVRDLDALSATLSRSGARVSAFSSLQTHLTTLRRNTDDVLDRLEREKARAIARGREPPQGLVDRMEAASSALSQLERELAWLVEGLSSDLRGAREDLQRLRLVPVNSMFSQLQRAARDAAETLGKQVRLSLAGGDVRVDGPVLALTREALLHLVRNAVAHGIESPEVRRRLGKDPEGHILLRADRRGGSVSFTCRDDGAGVDPSRVLGAAVARGLLDAETARSLPREEILRLLLRPGFSTQASVDSVAGRGVGLDVVQGVAAQVGGELRVDSEPGQWTQFTLTVPPSLASIRVLEVQSDGARALVPIDAVGWTVRISPEEIARSPEGESFSHAGEALPFAPLARLMGRPGAGARKRTRAGLVLQSGDQRAVLGVERVMGLSEVLLRPLPPSMAPVPLLLGASLDANGDPEAVLDPRTVVAAIRRAGGTETEQAPEPPLIMVVDDSLTTRMLEKSILESAGYRVELATNGEEALERARVLRPHAALVDVEMPGIDGFEVVRRLREDPVLHSMPAVLVTSRRSPEDKRRGIEVGARAYVVKSEFSQPRLLEIIRGLVGPRPGEEPR